MLSRIAFLLAAAVLGFMPLSAQAASECPVVGTMSSWGVNSTGYFNVSSGGRCLFPVKLDGVIAGSTVSQKPAHGTLKKVNASTYTYTAKAGYKGNDAFAVSFTGKGPSGSGTSVITLNATVQ
ncbi:Ig-like domain-containing protein [Bradyrhizobium arachidis]|uniref:Ig-like domain-containing protein n=1 Tax=Bradyrhizobium arachidis TaxID=858423 RepID=UPI0021612149|nr:Ig-like domain-containing protein [Bradyrhizobium arachidis]